MHFIFPTIIGLSGMFTTNLHFLNTCKETKTSKSQIFNFSTILKVLHLQTLTQSTCDGLHYKIRPYISDL